MPCSVNSIDTNTSEINEINNLIINNIGIYYTENNTIYFIILFKQNVNRVQNNHSIQRSFSAFTVTGPRDDAYSSLLRIAVLCNRAEFKVAQVWLHIIQNSIQNFQGFRFLDPHTGFKTRMYGRSFGFSLLFLFLHGSCIAKVLVNL